MFRRTTIIFGLVGLVLLGSLVAYASQSAQADNSAKGFKPALSVHHLMEGQGFVFGQIHDALTNANAPRRLKTIEAGSAVLAELANVNTLNSDKQDYQAWASELRDIALALAKEADKKADADDKQMNELFKQMKNKCGACHDAYQE